LLGKKNISLTDSWRSERPRWVLKLAERLGWHSQSRPGDRGGGRDESQEIFRQRGGALSRVEKQKLREILAERASGRDRRRRGAGEPFSAEEKSLLVCLTASRNDQQKGGRRQTAPAHRVATKAGASRALALREAAYARARGGRDRRRFRSTTWWKKCEIPELERTMGALTVHLGDRSYPIHVGENNLSEAGDLMRRAGLGKSRDRLIRAW
jgi:hypothetical protein